MAVIPAISNILNPSGPGYNSTNIRRYFSGLGLGGGTANLNRNAVRFMSSPTSPGAPEDDWRVRISLADSSTLFYKNTMAYVMQPLADTNGVIFPYTPSITVTHSATYNSQTLTHSNYAMQFYQNSEVNDIQITGEFTVQDATEGQYLLGAIYFFRACTKMFFGVDGQSGQASGNPPPLVYLDGYGEHYFPHVPCVLTAFSHTLPNDTDYVDVSVSSTVDGNDYETTSTKTRLPTSSSISITLRPVYSRKTLHDKFNLDDFAAGKLLKGNGSFL